MIIDKDTRYSVAIIGAGPAGLFAARELASRGIHTTLLNRDIKPGGLAEYGIYPSKLRMKEGLRSQFRQILAMQDISYYGNVLVGDWADCSLADLRGLGFHALLVTVGAQSTKRLGLPGEDILGVYHAKDIVYHYNVLPPFSETTYQIGKRVAVIGVGNVMMDITRWLVEEQNVESVVAVARRGPAEVKFDRKELESIIGFLDIQALQAELDRVEPLMRAIGQDPADFMKMIQAAAGKVENAFADPRFSLRFLASPARVLPGAHGRAASLEVEENMLVLSEDGETRPRGTGQHTLLDVDTVIFAIGDLVDSSIGLPMQYGQFVKNLQPRFPIEGVSYEAYDPETGQVIPDTFLAGWARLPSTGLVGVARKDGTNAAQVIAQYLQTLPPSDITVESVEANLRRLMLKLNHPVVDKQALLRLEAIEHERAAERSLPYYKYATNQEMLEVLGLVPSREK